MCGFVGYLDLAGRPVSEKVIARMRETIVHRGPDEVGLFLDGSVGLGFQRLAIIDLQGGSQPMESAEGRYVIVFNGELYNYLELRDEVSQDGFAFRTHSDTEVVLNLFVQRGPRALDVMNGMYAFAIWDRQARKLFMARDRIGIKPLYYLLESERFLFASEIKAIAKAPGFTVKPHWPAIRDYLTYMYPLSNHTFFEGVRAVLPGCWLEVDEQGNLRTGTYWDVSYQYVAERTAEATVDELAGLVRDAIRLQVRSDVPIGCHLSGGLDSSTVTTLASERLNHVKTFTGKFAEGDLFDETYYAKRVAERAKTEYLEVTPTESDFEDWVPALVYHMDMPAAGPGLVPQYGVCRLAGKHVKVVLGGQGGDELFAGYPRYFLAQTIGGNATSGGLNPRILLQRLQMLSRYVRKHGIAAVLRKAKKAVTLIGDLRAAWRRMSSPISLDHPVFTDLIRQLTAGYDQDTAFFQWMNQAKDAAPLDQMLYHDLKTYLPALLQVEDRTSMAVSLESRVPLLDHRIVEFSATIQPALKAGNGEPKEIFRRVIHDILPIEVVERQDKMGFPTPISVWFRGAARPFLRRILLDDAARQRGIINPDQVEALIEDDEDNSVLLWALLNVELWFKIFVDRVSEFDFLENGSPLAVGIPPRR